MRFRGAAVLLATAWLCGCRQPRLGVDVDIFHVTLGAAPDGTVTASERIILHSNTGAFERVVRNPQVDEVVFNSATIDGQDLQPGTTGLPSLSVEDGRSLTVRWRFEPSPAPHTLTLRYYAARAIGVVDDRGHLRWPMLPAGRDYSIGSGELTFRPPAGAALYATAVVERGWTMARQGDGTIGATASNIAAGDSATLQAEFSVDPKGMTEAAWQLNADRAFQLSFAWVSGALFILTIGGGVIWMLRFRARQGAADRASVHAALRKTGLVSIASAAFAFWMASLGMERFGILVMAVPASMLIVGGLFIAGRKWV